MPKVADETIGKIKLEIRRLMVREPGISGRRIGLLLGYDKDFINKLKKKVDGENRRELETSLIDKEIIALENIYKAMALEMYDIITSAESDGSKISAFSTLFKARRDLIDVKMDAGIFVRKMGEVRIELSDEQKGMLKKLLDFADEQAKP